MTMQAEALFFRPPPLNTNNPLVSEVSIRPGSSEVIDNKGMIKALATVDIDNLTGTIYVENPKRIDGFIFDDTREEDEPVRVDITGQIVITHGQMLSLVKDTNRGVREITFRLEKPDNDLIEDVQSPIDSRSVLV